MAYNENKQTKKTKKNHNNDFVRRIEELESQLSLKQDILERTDKKNSTLYDANRELKENKKILELEKEELMARVKQLDGNQQLDEDLLSSDAKSTRTGERWESLYSHEWTHAYEELCMHDKEEKIHRGPEKRLMAIIDWCYKKCSDLAADQMEQIKPLLSNIACYMQFQQPEGHKDNEQVSNTLESLIIHLKLQRQHDSDMVSQLKQKCVDEYKSTHEEVLKRELKFVEKCAELCWTMRISDPPMVIKHTNLEGTKFAISRFNRCKLESRQTELVVWPCLLLYENGPVVTKGIVRPFCEILVQDSCYDPHTSNTSPVDENIYEYPSNSSPLDENICEYPPNSSPLEEDIYDYPSNSSPLADSLNHQEIISHGCASSPSKESQTESANDNIYITMEVCKSQFPATTTPRTRFNPFDTQERPTTHYQSSKQSTATFHHLSKSGDFKSNLNHNEQKSKVADDVGDWKQPLSPKDGTFTSYLNSTL